MALQSSSEGPPVASQPHRPVYPTLSTALDLPSSLLPHTSNLPRIMGHSFTTPIHPTLVSPPSPATFSPPDFRVQSMHRLRHTQHEPATTINGGTFVGGNVIQRNGESGINILHRAVALEALHDSADSFPPPRCHPETRTEMLDELWKWSTKSDSATEPILWLHGPAGAGKSAIMKTLSQRLQDASRLGGAFFFKRGHPTRGHARTLFTTIAYQLALSIPVLKGLISQIVEDNPSVVGRSMDVQIRELILEPCRSLVNFQSCIIMIDGLDECEGLHIQQEILRLIGDSLHQLALPLRFLIASRPEAHIREVFEGSSFQGFYRAFNVNQSFEDVRTYFHTEFVRIHHEHRETMATVPSPWPSEELIHRLVDKSSGYFIYASTVIKFVDDKNFRPVQRLAAVESLVGSDFESPFGALDELYTQILSAVPARPRLIAILRVAVQLQIDSTDIEKLLGLEPGDVQLTLRGLHSVVDVGEYFVDFHHASFRDFLGDPMRAREFYTGGFADLKDLACSILTEFSYTYEDLSKNRIGPVALLVYHHQTFG
ncbi:hypothetical protein B0H10DRAFT_1262341 [Mycena sp. CBHHK59/15]|nr:hypothetical protein B0H10DRAFT_1262341 [Mycena sp. CBHHK59/15]